MECPKCHSIINDSSTVCPKCHKVLALECPNCHSHSETPVCSKCGYSILVKCSKCSKLNPVGKEKCSKCGFPVNTSLAYQECESDEFASISIKIDSLKKIKSSLKSKELYAKFYYRLKNLILAQVKSVECKLIIYGDVFVVNFNKELSFPTSSNKAVRFALKLMNAFSELNFNVLEEFGIPLNLNITITKKTSDKLQEYMTYETKVKPLLVKKSAKKYLKGLQIILDQYVFDEINKEYKTDSLYSIEDNGKTIMFYELILDSYVLPPSLNNDEKPAVAGKKVIVKPEEDSQEEDLYSFKVFDINAKCHFKKTNAAKIISRLKSCNLETTGKIIALKSTKEFAAITSDIIEFYKENDYQILTVSCSEELNFKPWGVLETLFKEYFNLASCKQYNNWEGIGENFLKAFNPLFALLLGNPIQAMSPEDARFTYMEQWSKFFSILKKTVIIFDGFEHLDDTTIQTLEIYFDKFKKIVPNFVFISSDNISVHSKIKGLLRTSLYTEFTLGKTSLDTCLADLKSDAADFIQSFYFEKIKENFKGSYLYFINAVNYLKDMGVLIDFENKLIVKSKKSVVLPKDVFGLYKARLKSLPKIFPCKNISANYSFIPAYSSILGARIDFKTLELLGITDIEKDLDKLANTGLIYYKQGILYINNYNQFVEVIKSSLKKEANTFLAKNIISSLGNHMDSANLALVFGLNEMYKEEYLNLLQNSYFAIKTGDFDAYLKNCLGFISLEEFVVEKLPKEQLEDNKKDVYNNILTCLYSYSPSKIYFIENTLLVDAINAEDNEKIVKLSNLMLQGALITSNYTDAQALLHNILSRTPEPALVVNGAVNTRFLLLLLVNIEILYNIGNYRECVETAEEILSVINVDILDKIKPPGFSVNLFVSHLLETFRLVGFAKLYLLDNDLEEFFDKVKTALNIEFPEKDCILAIKDFLAGKVYSNGNLEEYSAFSKIIFLILQEINKLKDDYKTFAQNIYQAKLLALEIHQKEIELFCDLLIAFAYSKIGIKQKADSIYKNILETAENSMLFTILAIVKYFIAQNSPYEEALILINDTLALLQKQQNQAKILYVLFETLYIKISEEYEITTIDIESELQKIEPYKESLKFLIASLLTSFLAESRDSDEC